MKFTPSRSLLYFLLASLFAVMAQSFLLIPQQQKVLLEGNPPAYILVFSIVLLFLAYLNLTLAFYQHTRMWEKSIGWLSAFALLLLAFLYIRARLYIEVFPLLFTTGLTLLVLWGDKPLGDWLGRAYLWMNILLGVAFLLPELSLTSDVYQPAFSLRRFFSLFFLLTALFKFLTDFKPDTSLARHSTKLLAFPWIGWALLFSLDLALPILIPAILLSFALLSFGLLPFEKFRLPDNKMLGHSLFPLLSLLFSFILAIFTFLRNAVLESMPVDGFLFFFSLALSTFFVYVVMRGHYLLYQLTEHPYNDDARFKKGEAFEKLVEFLFAPFQKTQPISERQEQKLTEELIVEREKVKHLEMLNLLRNQLDEFHDDPVSAQLVVNTVERYFDADLVSVLLAEIDTHELVNYAVGGRLKTYAPANYRQSMDVGVLGRAARTQKIQVVNDTSRDPDHFSLRGEEIGSEVVVPILHHQQLKGVFMVAAVEKEVFSAADIRVLEAIVEELLKTWERNGYNRRMQTLIQSSISLSTSLDPQSAIEEITQVARETLFARFVFVTLLDKEGTFTRFSSVGYAPSLQEYLSQDLNKNPMLKVALAQKEPYRIRDVRRYKNIPEVPLDHGMLRGVMMVPIRLHGVSIGAIMAFGKQGAVFFSEQDEALGNLLATQAAAAVESSWLIQELRANAFTTNLLYHLSIEVIQTNTIREAARLIANTAQRLTQSCSVGIILFSLERKVETALEIGADGRLALGRTIPLQFVEQALIAGEVITISSGENSATIYLPIQTSLRKYGVLWTEFQDSERQAAAQTQTLQTLANQAAMALERTMLLLDLRRKADELKDAFQKLENTYDQTLIALMAALDARDRETEGHSTRVGNVACRIAEEMELDPEQITILRRGALLHDIGKIGVSDNILHKPGPLTNDEWRIMRQHPVVGAHIVKGIPFLEDTIPVIQHHHERWNGSGYPLGLEGEDIPVTARIFAVADVFDALTSVRPYRKTSTNKEAFSYLTENSGILFDPNIVSIFEKLLRNGQIEELMSE